MVVEPPSPGNKDYDSDYAGPGNVGNTGGWVTKAVANVRHHKQAHISNKTVMADTVAGACAAYVEPDAGREHEDLHHQGSSDRVPQSETEARPAGIKRHIGAMGYPVEDTVAYDADPDGNRAGQIVCDPVIDQRESASPNDAHEQAV